MKVVRGGSWIDSPRFVRSANRGWFNTVDRYYIRGFRLIKEESHMKVVRGGSWFSIPRYVRSADRGRSSTEFRVIDRGFRVARTTPVSSKTSTTGTQNMKTIEIDGIKYELRKIETDICPETVTVPGGSFLIGSPDDEEGRYGDEGPQREIEVKSFEIQKYQTTFEEYDKFCDETGRKHPDDEGWGRGARPVINVTYEDAAEYANWLSEKTGGKWRLPTEEEWEYACRAGSDTRYCFGDDEKELSDYAVYDGERTEPVGSKKPNNWGIFDMHGNVWEWTSTDWKTSP